jgi:hypothetical protein
MKRPREKHRVDRSIILKLGTVADIDVISWKSIRYRYGLSVSTYRLVFWWHKITVIYDSTEKS